MITYRARAGLTKCRVESPLASCALALTGIVLSAGSSPTRICRLAPGALPSRIRRLVTVTRRPMSSSRPVPDLSMPNLAVAYQSVCPGWPASRATTFPPRPPPPPDPRPPPGLLRGEAGADRPVTPAGRSPLSGRDSHRRLGEGCLGDGSGVRVRYRVVGPEWLVVVGGQGRGVPGRVVPRRR